MKVAGKKGAGNNVEHLVEGTRKAKEVLRNDIRKKKLVRMKPPYDPLPGTERRGRSQSLESRVNYPPP